MASARRHHRHHWPARPAPLRFQRLRPRLPAAAEPDSLLYRHCAAAMAMASGLARVGYHINACGATPALFVAGDPGRRAK